MASTYPGTLDAFTTIASDKKTSDSVGGRTHRDMHNDLGDAVEAVQAELGTDPAGTFSTVKARLDQLVAYAAKTSAYTATVADHTLNVTSGTFTLDLPAASTCTGQSLNVKNSGTGVVTLDGNSSETVDGIATYPLGPRSYVQITSTGSAWILTGGTPDTGWRDISSLMNSTDWKLGAVVGGFRMRRHGATVWFAARLQRVTAGAGISVTSTLLASAVPAGFMPANGYWARGVAFSPSRPVGQINDSGATGLWRVLFDGVSGNWATDEYLQFEMSYPTSDAWPTSLPGTAA